MDLDHAAPYLPWPDLVTSPTSLFERDDAVLRPTSLTRGPWDHGFLHGGAVCAAAGWALETDAAVAKPGKRTRIIEANLSHEGRVLVRATSQWVSY